jgi:hypothetical protein
MLWRDLAKPRAGLARSQNGMFGRAGRSEPSARAPVIDIVDAG